MSLHCKSFLLSPRTIAATVPLTGDANFTFEKYEQCEELVEFYLSSEFKGLSFWKSKPFVKAIRFFFERSDRKQRDKLKRKSLAIPLCASHVQYETVFENLVKMRR